MYPRAMEQEIKELQAGLGTVVQALNFMLTFLESDYGLKFQFQAYCNSPPYSQNSNVLDAVKQKYGSLGTGNATNDTARSYQRQQQSSNPPLVGGSGAGGSASQQQRQQNVRFQNRQASANANNLPSSSCSSESLTEQEQSFISLTNVTNDLSSHLHHQATTMVDGTNVNVERAPIFDNEGNIIFNIDDLSKAVKEESHPDPDFMLQNDAEGDAYGNPELEDEDDSDSITNDHGEHSVGHQNSAGTVEVPTIPFSVKAVDTGKKKRSQKGKLKEGFKCPNCRRRCPDMASLQLHMAHHTQQFRCSECGIGLAGKSVLKRHMRTHTGDRPFSCEYCQETFARQDIVKKHIQRKHKSETGGSG